MVPTISFGLLNMPTQMTVSLFAGFASVMIINIEKFEYFKAGQLEARLRKADKIIKEAHATVDQLKEVAEPLLNTNLASLAYEGYFDGMDVEDKMKVFAALYEVENSLELNSYTTKDLMDKTKKSISYHLFRNIGETINTDGLSAEAVFFSKYSIEADKAFSTVEEIDNYLYENPNLRTKEVMKSFEKFKKFINNYY